MINKKQAKDTLKKEQGLSEDMVCFLMDLVCKSLIKDSIKQLAAEQKPALPEVTVTVKKTFRKMESRNLAETPSLLSQPEIRKSLSSGTKSFVQQQQSRIKTNLRNTPILNTASNSATKIVPT